MRHYFLAELLQKERFTLTLAFRPYRLESDDSWACLRALRAAGLEHRSTRQQPALLGSLEYALT